MYPLPRNSVLTSLAKITKITKLLSTTKLPLWWSAFSPNRTEHAPSSNTNSETNDYSQQHLWPYGIGAYEIWILVFWAATNVWMNRILITFRIFFIAKSRKSVPICGHGGCKNHIQSGNTFAQVVINIWPPFQLLSPSLCGPSMDCTSRSSWLF